jgi:uncharacterized protein
MFREYSFVYFLKNGVTVFASYQPGALEVSQADWIVVKTVENGGQVEILRYYLDPGEAESIVLAKEAKADLLIMDESIGRGIAGYLGVAYTGTIGALLEAKSKGIIERILPVLEELRDKAGFRISASLFNHALVLADEI